LGFLSIAEKVQISCHFRYQNRPNSLRMTGLLTMKKHPITKNFIWPAYWFTLHPCRAFSLSADNSKLQIFFWTIYWLLSYYYL